MLTSHFSIVTKKCWTVSAANIKTSTTFPASFENENLFISQQRTKMDEYIQMRPGEKKKNKT